MCHLYLHYSQLENYPASLTQMVTMHIMATAKPRALY